MPIPALNDDGDLPPGIHSASIREVAERFGTGSPARERQANLLRTVLEASARYAHIKRVLIWGSFVTSKPEPVDVDYSIVVSVAYDPSALEEADRRFLSPVAARVYYGVDRNYLVIYDYPLGEYVELMDFLCHTRQGRARGIVEVHVPHTGNGG